MRCMKVPDTLFLQSRLEGRKRVFDAVIISDLHLGSHNCQAAHLCGLLESIREQEIRTQRLILNGDVFDSYDFRRLNKSHWRVLSLIRKLSDQIEIVWVCGNHDGSAEVISHLLGVAVEDEYVLASGDDKILILHGHVFDQFLDSHPVLTWVGDQIYYFLQWIDRTHYFAKMAKRGSKTFLRCAQLIEDGAIAYAGKKKCRAVCCGHTHLAVSKEAGPVGYFNSGCWTELPCSYLTVAGGIVQLSHFEPDPLPEAVEEPMDLVQA
jgi:UDP-2,3-diacylglucosamine pyrophosphatase LpxH